MGRKSKISSDEKLNAVTRCIYGDISIGQMEVFIFASYYAGRPCLPC